MKVKFFATFRDMVNLKELEMDIPLTKSKSPTIKMLLDDIIEKYPLLQTEIYNDDGTVRKMTHILVNGRNIIHLDGLQTRIKSSDEVALIPPVGGG